MVLGLFEGDKQKEAEKAFWDRAYERGLVNEWQWHDEMVKLGIDAKLKKVF